MKSVLLITWANIKRRKVQTLLVGICIALAALLFSTVIGMSIGMQRPFDNLFEKLKASHIVLDFDIHVHDPQEITEWFNAQEEVVSVGVPKSRRYMRQFPQFKGEELVNSAYLTEFHGNDLENDRLDILQGSESRFPLPGEIWVPNNWLKGADITIGDTIMVPTSNGLFPLTVAAIAIDPHHSNGLINPEPAWVGPGTLSMLFPVKDLTRVVMGIRLTDPEVTEAVWKKFNEEYSYRGFSRLYKEYKSFFQILYQITGGILLIFVIFGIIVTLIVTSSVVSSSIRTDYKMIGMLKTQGFTKRNMISVYVIQFMLITCLAVPIGLIGGYFTTLLVFKSLITAIGSVNFDIGLLAPSIWTFFAFLIAILLISYRSAIGATHIQPVTAIRNNGPPQKSYGNSKFGLFKLGPRSNVVSFLSMRFLRSNIMRAVLLFVGLSFVIFVQMLYVNGSSSLSGLNSNRPAWGFNYCDVGVRQSGPQLPNQQDFFKEDMEDDERVKEVVKIGGYTATLPATETRAPKPIEGTIYDDELEKVGHIVVEGRHPVFEDELSLGLTSQKSLGVEIGDSIGLYMEGQLVHYTITGIYQSLNNLSEGFFMRLEGIQEVNPLYELRGYQIKLKKGEDHQAFADDLIKTYGSAYDVFIISERLGNLENILNGVKDLLTLISALFLGILFVTVFNDTVLSIKETQRNIGIFKAIGMTPFQLQMALIIRAIIIAVIALAIAVPLSLYIIPVALGKFTVFAGLATFPYLFDATGSLLVIPFILVLTIITVWLASRRLLKIRPRILVRE
jgi:putative ABC transport system permease protein